ncbi:PHP domain-containing protein [bacterium]|nr:PHP domain-containing protein [bacterium]
MDKLADLHTHTTSSDGCHTPTQVVEAAAKAGLTAVAITDHDTVAGIDEALEAGKHNWIEVIPGIEISTIYHDKVEVHILGYFIDHKSPSLIEKLDVLKNARYDRARQMVEKLNAVGVHISFDRVLELAQHGAVGRPHVAKAICEVGAASSMDSAFGRFLQEGGPGYVPRYKVTPLEAMEIISEAGGVSCAAHVAKLRRDEIIVELVGSGLRAIEVNHPDHSSAGRKFYKRFAQSRGLIATGGSDAHGFAGNIRPGVGDVTVPYGVVIELRIKSRLRREC